ncbi:MAG: helix-turn-helix domain-containing protein [Leptolyngbya sp. SIO3F4]|nr:helix-turn-helix domain-containing protein [Leptolyngbya sp. SIO3F4]
MQIRMGECLLVPEGVVHWCSWSQPKGSVLMIEIEHNFLSQVAYEKMEPNRTELVPTFLTPDPIIYGIGLAFYKTLEANQPNDLLYVETLSQSLTVHLLRNYATLRSWQDNQAEGLSQRQLRRVLDYINHSLEQSVILTRIPILLEMSQYRFSQLFQRSIGMSPYQYVVQKRVERARQLLGQTPQLSLTEVAKQCGFTNQKHLTRHLFRLVGDISKS